MRTIDYWKCSPCHGTGEQIISGSIVKCDACDGTGNALVDGPASRHRRELDRIRRAEGKFLYLCENPPPAPEYLKEQFRRFGSKWVTVP